MGSLTDLIETHLKQLILSRGGLLEVRRSELAEHFGCAPSQINYVLLTRFTPERGYLVESRRGGAGYLRIRRLGEPDQEELTTLCHGLDAGIDQASALDLLLRLKEADIVDGREWAVMSAAMRREVLAAPLPERDRLRGRLLRAMLLSLLQA